MCTRFFQFHFSYGNIKNSYNGLYHGGKKCGNWEAPSQEMLVFGGKFLNLVGNFVSFVHKNV